MQNAWLFSVNMLVYFIFVSLCPSVHLPISFFYKLNVLSNLPARLGWDSSRCLVGSRSGGAGFLALDMFGKTKINVDFDLFVFLNMATTTGPTAFLQIDLRSAQMHKRCEKQFLMCDRHSIVAERGQETEKLTTQQLQTTPSLETLSHVHSHHHQPVPNSWWQLLALPHHHSYHHPSCFGRPHCSLWDSCERNVGRFCIYRWLYRRLCRNQLGWMSQFLRVMDRCVNRHWSSCK